MDGHAILQMQKLDMEGLYTASSWQNQNLNTVQF